MKLHPLHRSRRIQDPLVRPGYVVNVPAAVEMLIGTSSAARMTVVFRFQPRTSLSAASTGLEGFGVVWTGSDDVEVSYLQPLLSLSALAWVSHFSNRAQSLDPEATLRRHVETEAP